MESSLVQDWMTRDLITITRNTLLHDACRLMKESGIRHLPVLEGGKLAGLVTRGDLREASASDAASLSIFEQNYLLAQLTVGEIMTRNPITVIPSVPIGHAVQVMLDHKISCLPVLDHGKLVGIITESDIFRMLVMGQVA